MSHKVRLYDSWESLHVVGIKIDGVLAENWQREGGKCSIMHLMGWLMLEDVGESTRTRVDESKSEEDFKFSGLVSYAFLDVLR